MAETSTKPYLIRAIHEWCTDNGYRPYVAVAVDERTIVPREFVRNGEIVLNMSADATNRLRIGNDLIEFEARFNRAAREVSIPIENVTAVYAAENGHGMAFDVPRPGAAAPEPSESSGAADEDAQGSSGRPQPAPARTPPRGPALLEAVPTSAPDRPETDESPGPPEPPPPPPPGGRPKLTRIK